MEGKIKNKMVEKRAGVAVLQIAVKGRNKTVRIWVLEQKSRLFCI
jgi:hypothetical protein